MSNKALETGYWDALRTVDFTRIDPEINVALLPVSAIEQHGPHLPLSTDATINAGVINALLAKPPRQAKVLVLPAQTIGDSIEHSERPGTITASLESVLGMWLDIGDSIARSGIRKLIIFNTHGGQRGHVDQAAVRLRAEHAMMVARANSGNLGKPDGLFSENERAHGLHGGAIETSLMLHLRPDLVHMEHSKNFVSSAQAMSENQHLGMERGVGIGWMAQDLNSAGVVGDASIATPELGQRLLTHMSDALSTLCDELAATPLSTLKDY
jgi:creatinine amidohydrolase